MYGSPDSHHFPLSAALVLLACATGTVGQDYFAPLDELKSNPHYQPIGGQNFTRCCLQALQDWNTNDMCFDVPTLIEFLSGSKTLLPGTIILTGTPHGVGGARKPPVFMHPGDTVSIVIERIGTLTNPVINEPL